MTSPFIFSSTDSQFNIPPGADLIVMMMSREHVEAGLVGDMVDRLMTLSDSADYSLRFAQSVAFMVSGYDDDPRELPTIPEVRRYFQSLSEAWPYAFHFLSVATETLPLYIHFQLESLPESRQGNQCFYSIEPKTLGDLMRRHFESMNALHELHQVPVSKRKEITDSIIRIIDQNFPGA